MMFSGLGGASWVEGSTLTHRQTVLLKAAANLSQPRKGADQSSGGPTPCGRASARAAGDQCAGRRRPPAVSVQPRSVLFLLDFPFFCVEFIGCVESRSVSAPRRLPGAESGPSESVPRPGRRSAAAGRLLTSWLKCPTKSQAHASRGKGGRVVAR